MAIDRVYLTTQELLNKEQRGFLVPDEFNNLANLAQTEIFEAYFHEYNLVANANKIGRISSEYANIPEHLKEKINLLAVKESLTVTAGVVTLPTNLYRLTSVRSSESFVEEEDKHDWSEFTKLGKASIKRPVFSRYGNTLEILPITLTENVTVEYIRKPNAPKWGYIMVDEEPFYESSRSTEYDLHPSDETELIIKILFYAGLAIKATDVVQVADKIMTTDYQKENNLPF